MSETHPIHTMPVRFCAHCGIIWQALEGEKCPNCNSTKEPIVGLFTSEGMEIMLHPPNERETLDEKLDEAEGLTR